METSWDRLTAHRVLVVEGSTLARKSLATVLSREGYEPLVPEDLEQAAAMALREQPHLVLLASELPRDAVHRFLRVVRSSYRTALLPIVLLASQPDESQALMRAYLAVGQLAKPIQSELLRGLLEDQLAPKPQMGSAAWLASVDEPTSAMHAIVKGVSRQDGADLFTFRLSSGLAEALRGEVTVRFQAADGVELTARGLVKEATAADAVVLQVLSLPPRHLPPRLLRKTIAMRVQYQLLDEFPRTGLCQELSLAGMRLTNVLGLPRGGTPIRITLVINDHVQIEGLSGTITHADPEGAFWDVAFEPLPGELADQVLLVLFGDPRDWAVVLE